MNLQWDSFQNKILGNVGSVRYLPFGYVMSMTMASTSIIMIMSSTFVQFVHVCWIPFASNLGCYDQRLTQLIKK